MFERIKARLRSGAMAALGLDPRGSWVTTGGNYNAGEQVNERSMLSVATYFACCRNVAEDIAKLPFSFLQNVIQDNRDAKIKYNDDLSKLLAVSPNPWMTAYSFTVLIVFWIKSWGNAFAEIQRNARGRIIALYPIHPSRVVPKIDSKTERLFYQVYNNDGTVIDYNENEILKFINTSADGRIGLSVLRLMTNTLSLAQQAQLYAKNYLANSARPAGVLETELNLKEEARNNLKRSWAEQYSGADNAGKTPVLESGVTYKPLSIPMRDMQFLELRAFQREEICSWFRMPLYKVQVIGSAQGFSTLDAQESDYVNSGLIPTITSMEQDVKRQLMQGYPETINPKYDVKGLLRGAMKDRSEFCKALFTNGIITPNEWRQYEDMNPIDDPAMDKTYIQGAFVPLDMAGKLQQQALQGQSGDNKPLTAIEKRLLNGIHN